MDEKILVQEAYYGKSNTILAAEKVLDVLLSEVRKNPLNDYTNHGLTKKFSDLICRQFGFKKVIISWKRTPRTLANAETFFSLDVVSDQYNEFTMIDRKTGLYDKYHNHVVYMVISSTMISQSNLSSEELMAIILHEIGHNFDKSIYASIKVGNALFVSLCRAFSGDTNGIVNTLSMTNIGKQIGGNIASTVEELKDSLSPLKKLSMKLKSFMDWFMRGVEYLMAPAVILTTPLWILCSPFSQLMTIPDRKMEEFADSFAAAYGYGPALASGLNKIESTNIILYDKKPKLTGIKKTLGDLVMAQRYIMSITMDGTHGTNDIRIRSNIAMLKKDLEREDYPLEVKTEIMNQINDLEEAYKTYLSLDPEKGQGHITHLMRKCFSSLFKGRSDYIAKIFPENTVNRFESTENEKSYYNILNTLYEKVDNNEITLEQAYEVNDLAFEKYMTEGAIKRLISKSDNNTKARVVLNCWASPKNLPSEDKAKELITKLEKSNITNADAYMDIDFIKAMAVTNYPQSKFIKIVSKFDDEDMPNWMLGLSEIELIKSNELTDEIRDLLKEIDDDNKKREIIKKFIIDKSKKYGELEVKNQTVFKVSSKNKICVEALRYWKGKKFKVVCPDGGGNYLLYSIDNGKFYDYFHEQDLGDNYKEWLKSGITYKDFMNNIRKGVQKNEI